METTKEKILFALIVENHPVVLCLKIFKIFTGLKSDIFYYRYMTAKTLLNAFIPEIKIIKKYQVNKYNLNHKKNIY
jgi:hypothetical protein